MKRAVLVHGWAGEPDHGWFPWLSAELTKHGFVTIAPQMPETAHPRIETWVPVLQEAVGTPDKDTYLVGHSMGCETIARYLEALPEGVEVGGVLYVAGFFRRLTGLDAGDVPIWEAWRTTPLDLAKVREHAPKSIALFSDNDPYVPLDNAADFRDALSSEVHILHGKDHFSGDEGYAELPEALTAVLALSR